MRILFYQVPHSAHLAFGTWFDSRAQHTFVSCGLDAATKRWGGGGGRAMLKGQTLELSTSL